MTLSEQDILPEEHLMTLSLLMRLDGLLGYVCF